MVRANSLRKVPVFPWVIEMIMRVVASGIVSDPGVICGMNVRSLRMTFLVGKRAPLRRWSFYTRSPYRCRAVRRNVASANASLRSGMWRRRGMPMLLRKCAQREHHSYCKQAC